MVVPSTLADRFDIEREVAVGGMGRVYRGRDRLRGESVAIKLLVRSDSQARARFLREAAVLAEFNHPGIVRYVAHGHTDDGGAYLVMEWLEGVELGQFLDQRVESRSALMDTDRLDTEESIAGIAAGTEEHVPDLPVDLPEATSTVVIRRTARWTPARSPASRSASTAGPVAPMDLAECVFLGHRLALALSALHERNIVHRDIKPGNLFLVDGKLARLKLLDLGAVWRFDELGRLTRTGYVLGTPKYMAPEQVESDGQICPATDVWAMGVLLYQCCTGAVPFAGEGISALLASIILSNPTPVHELCAGMPTELAELIMQMLAKRASERPKSAVEVGARLQTIAEMLPAVGDHGEAGEAALGRASSPPVNVRASGQPASLTTTERRLACMLFMFPIAPAEPREPREPESDRHRRSADLARQIERFGGQAHHLVDGTTLITIRGQYSSTEQATLAARMAIAVNCAVRDALLVLVTGRTEGERPVPMVASEAMGISRETRPGTIRVDDMTASLVETRFHLVRDNCALYLGEERAFPAARMIFGQPSKWSGRRRALTTLLMTFEECVDSESARAVLVTGAGGMGKSRLCREFLSALDSSDTRHRRLYGGGDMARAGSPLDILAPAMGRYLGLLPGEPTYTVHAKIRASVARLGMDAERADGVAAFLGEMLGVGFPDDFHPALKAARADVRFRADAIQRAWLEFLQAECARAPVLLIVEDLHWGDQPSVSFIDSALATLRDAPFMVLALARPEVEGRFPQLWRKRDVTTLRLHPLSPKECRGLVEHALGAGCDQRTVAGIVERAGGNPFVVEELLRMVGRGSTSLPDTVLAVGQDRLAVLDPDAKRVLRAASVSGETFWATGVQELLGSADSAEFATWLRVLEDGDFIIRSTSSRFPGHAEYRFEHALVRDTAYALLTDDDRATGHAVAATWLERAGERDALVLAEHWMASNHPERAIEYFCRAAEDALAADDVHAARACADAAEQAGATGRHLGRAALIQSSAAGWLSDYRVSRERALVALDRMPTGSAPWFMAAGNAAAASYRLGDQEGGRQLATTASVTSCDAGAEAHLIVCLCRAGYQEFFDGRLDHGHALIERITAISESRARLDVRTQGQIHSILSLRDHLVGAWDEAYRHSHATIAMFERAGDIRNHLTERIALAYLQNSVGRAEQSVAHAREIYRLSAEYGLQLQRQQAKGALGCAFAELGRAAEAEPLLTEIAAALRSQGNRRMLGFTLINLADLSLQLGRPGDAENLALEAVEHLQGSLIFLSWALAVHALASLAVGRTGAALAGAERAYDICHRQSGHRNRRGLVYYALVRALHAEGRLDEARAWGAHGMADLQTSAGQFRAPDDRRAFLSSASNRQFVAWAAKHGIAGSAATDRG